MLLILEGRSELYRYSETLLLKIAAVIKIRLRTQEIGIFEVIKLNVVIVVKIKIKN